MTCRDQPMEISTVPYDYSDERLDPAKPKADGQRPPHPVTMMIKRVLMAAVDLLELPPNPLDQLTHLCGGREVVAEMTGRTEMMECQPDGSFLAVKRARDIKQQELNITVRPPAAARNLCYTCWGSVVTGSCDSLQPAVHVKSASRALAWAVHPSSRRSPSLCCVHLQMPCFRGAHLDVLSRLNSISAATWSACSSAPAALHRFAAAFHAATRCASVNTASSL